MIKTCTISATSERNTLVVPVTFDKGTASDVTSKNPPNMRSKIQAGNMQFRAYNASGYPNAFCPGIRFVKNIRCFCAMP